MVEAPNSSIAADIIHLIRTSWEGQNPEGRMQQKKRVQSSWYGQIQDDHQYAHFCTYMTGKKIYSSSGDPKKN